MTESTKRHKENSNIIKEIRASANAAIRNQGASIKTLEIKIGHMSKVLQRSEGIGNLVDLEASVSVMPVCTYSNLGLGDLAHTRIGKFVFPIYFVILDIPEDDDVPLILGNDIPYLAASKPR
ncbi:hypothetical protein Tco_0199801 [Tanacetum coccineum]